MEEKRGMFVVVGGPSGSGKGELVKSLAENLRELGLRVGTYAEEDEDPNRGEIREAKNRGGDREAAQIFAAHRREIYSRIVEPALREFDIVLVDRGEIDTEGYQTSSGEITMEEVYQMHREAGIRFPDLAVILICPPETTAVRMKKDEGGVRQERERGPGLSGKFSGSLDLEGKSRIYHQYERLVSFLEGKGKNVVLINSESLSVAEETKIVLREMAKM